METALTVVSVAGTLGSILFAYLAFSRAKSKDEEQEGQHSGTILTEIGYIKANTDEIKKKQDLQEQRHLEVVSRLVAVEVSAKQAHRRIDTLENDRRKDEVL